MSLLDLGPVLFGGNEKILAFLCQNRLLARSQTCARFGIMMNKYVIYNNKIGVLYTWKRGLEMMSQISLVGGAGRAKQERVSEKADSSQKAR